MTRHPDDSAHDSASVARAIRTRRAVRAFRPDPVPAETVAALLDLAAQAPSGTNMQPWRVYAVAGEARRRLCDAVESAFLAGEAGEPAHRYYPETFFEPYLGRRRQVGYGLYALLGIPKGDSARMKAQHARNFRFFDAPVGLIFTIDARLAIGSWLDYGGFLQTLMIAARAHGLDTCPQAAFAPYHAVIRRHLPVGDEESVVCGMALGYADPHAPENRLAPEREPVSCFATMLGFEGPRGG
ncbi:nitroreductase [Methylobacterium isbiliense]|jgi:nitroreductase|uniref:Nitrobenzene nitroreductase n=1 Tax=Methylobacterium isbiliense TaxID=315478 RepID=A0ABQ4SS62_9HYPH|nr:nitroreductase [Methylobacterium isbiliense]MDN3627266.1 nitroreductase [Methylobacterium isbiliense]GJE04506.1 Nitrobenzene nitroreductase [Methylobacterium isbiliense]